MGKYARLGKNTILIFIGNIGSKLISVLMLPFYTSWLSTKDYGSLDLISVYGFFLTGFITCCLADAIFRFPKDQKKKIQTQYFSSGSFFSILSFAIAGMLFYMVTRFLPETSFFRHYASAIYLIIFAGYLQMYTQQFVRSIDRMNIYVIAGIANTVFFTLFSFLWVPSLHLEGYIRAQILSSLLTCIYTCIHGRIDKYFSFQAIRKEPIRQMLYYSIPLIPNSLIWWAVSSSNRFFIQGSDSLDLIGIFAVANKFPAFIMIIFNIFFYSWQISVLEEFGKPHYKAFYNKIFAFVYSFLTLLVIALIVSSYWLVDWFTDEKFIDAWKYIPVLSVAVFLNALSTFVGVTFTVTKKTKYFLTSSIWAALVALALNFLLIPKWGLTGAALSILLSNATMFIMRLRKSWQFSPISGGWNYLISFALCVSLIPEMSINNLYLKIGLMFVSFIGLLWNQQYIMNPIIVLKTIYKRV